MTLISEDMMAHQGMTMDTHSRKWVRVVSGQRLDNSGTVTFGIEYQGRTTDLEALVLSSIACEVQLSWQVCEQKKIMTLQYACIHTLVSTTG